MEINEVVIFYFNLFFNQSKLAALSGVRFTKMRNSSNEMEVFFESIAINNKPNGHFTNSKILQIRSVSIDLHAMNARLSTFFLSGVNFLLKPTFYQGVRQTSQDFCQIENPCQNR